jgi:desampylase
MLILPAILWREIEERTRHALPEEACGLLLGARRGDEVEVSALAALRNVAPEPRDAFELDPLDLLAAEDGARDSGLSIVGVWHSHPRGPLEISARDRLGNGCAGWITAIAVPRARQGIRLACWLPKAHGFLRVEVAPRVPTRA